MHLSHLIPLTAENRGFHPYRISQVAIVLSLESTDSDFFPMGVTHGLFSFYERRWGLISPPSHTTSGFIWKSLSDFHGFFSKNCCYFWNHYGWVTKLENGAGTKEDKARLKRWCSRRSTCCTSMRSRIWSPRTMSTLSRLVATCNPSTREEETGGPITNWLPAVSKWRSSEFIKRPFLKSTSRGRVPEKDTQCQPPNSRDACVNMYICTHAPTHMRNACTRVVYHTHTHSREKKESLGMKAFLLLLVI